MRRVIASISNFAEVGDITSLANPEIIDDVRREKAERGEAPRVLRPQELAEIGHSARRRR